MNKRYNINLKKLKEGVKVICKDCGDDITGSLEQGSCISDTTYFCCNNPNCKSYCRRVYVD